MKGIIKINSEHCKGCGYCTGSCPAGVISMSNSFNKCGYFPAFAKYPDQCSGCAICANMCPEVAIEVYRDSTDGK